MDHEIAKQTESSKTLIDLDDDTLYIIMEFLKLTDVLALICSNTRFAAPFQMYARSYLKEIDLRFELSSAPQALSLLFEIAGQTIQTLHLPMSFERKKCKDGFSLVGSKCLNLRNLKISKDYPESLCHEELTKFQLDGIFTNTLKLRTIDLLKVALNRHFWNAIKHLPELECIGLHDCGDITTDNSHHLFPNIKKLSLFFGHTTEYFGSQNLLLSMPNLTVLFFEASVFNKRDGRYKEVWSDINKIPMLCTKLENVRLHIEDMEHIRWAIELPKLKSLSFNYKSRNISEFREFVQSKQDKLTSLKFNWHSSGFNRHILQLTTQFRCLKTLHLSDWCYSLDDSDLIALSVLKDLVEIRMIEQHKITNSGILAFVNTCCKLKWVNISYCTEINNEFVRLLLPLIKNSNRERITFVALATIINPTEFALDEFKERVRFLMDYEDIEQLIKTSEYDNFDDDIEEYTDFFD